MSKKTYKQPLTHASLPGTQWNESIQSLIAHPLLRGIVVFKENYNEVKTLKPWIKEIKRLNPRIQISIDQEGGLVQRLRPRSFILQPNADSFTHPAIEGILAQDTTHKEKLEHQHPSLPVRIHHQKASHSQIWVANPFSGPAHKRWLKTWEKLALIAPKETIWLTNDRSLLSLAGPTPLEWSPFNPFPLFDEFQAYPSAFDTAQSFEKSPKEVYEMWHSMASELAPLIDVYWGPVVDIHDPTCPIIGGMNRSFSNNPETIYQMSESFLNIFHSHGIQVCAKHFPGHGKTQLDSHLELPTDERSLAEIERDLAPYRLPWDWVMTAHVAYPNAYGPHPATYEPRALEWLKKRSKSTIITDCLAMSALEQFDDCSQTWETRMKNRMLRAHQAGHDHVMLTHQDPEALLLVLDQMLHNNKKTHQLTSSIQANSNVMD